MSTDVKSMHMGQITSFFIPTVTLVGQNCSTQIPDRLKSLGGKKPLIVTDQGIVAVGILKQITDILDAAGMQYAVYDKTVPNPTDKNVEEATEAYKSNGCDSLITLGGGSSHDCGKGVGFAGAVSHGEIVACPAYHSVGRRPQVSLLAEAYQLYVGGLAERIGGVGYGRHDAFGLKSGYRSSGESAHRPAHRHGFKYIHMAICFGCFRIVKLLNFLKLLKFFH